MRILTVLSLLVLLLCGMGWWITHIDWERYRPELAAQISDALGAEVQLGGKLSITFFPYPKLSAEDAELTASGLHIEAPHLRLTAKLWPLLRGRVILSSADIEDPKIVINPKLWQNPPAPQDLVSHTKVQLEDVEIKNGELDIALGQDHELITEIDLQLRAPDWHGPYQANADFIWHGQEWELASQLGIETAAGTRPANFTLRQNDGPNQFAWHGAMQPVPLAMRGDGEWHSATDNLVLQAEANWSDQVIEISRGVLLSGNKILGPVNGHFIAGKNIWQNLDVNLAEFSTGWLSGLLPMPLDSVWHKFMATGQLQFHLQNGVFKKLQFNAPQMSAILNYGRWHVWGYSASDVLALWGRSDTLAWPAELNVPFDMKLSEIKTGTEIESLRLGKMQSHGSLADQQLDLQTDALGWPAADSMDVWRAILRELNLQKFTLHVRQWDLAPLSSGDSKMVLTLNKETDHLALQTPGFHILGDFQDDNFRGQMECNENHLLQIFRVGCGAAKISSDGNKWEFAGITNAGEKLENKWLGGIDFAATTWDLHIPFNHGEVSAEGKLGQSDWRMDVVNLNLSEFLQTFVPGAPKGEGDLSAQLNVMTDKADGDLTASNLQLSGLNLVLDNAAQPGKISSLTGKINWQGGVLEIQQIHTTGPEGFGHASVNLDSAAWHGDWAEARGSNHVAIDGPADSAAAQRYHFIEAPRSELR